MNSLDFAVDNGVHDDMSEHRMECRNACNAAAVDWNSSNMTSAAAIVHSVPWQRGDSPGDDHSVATRQKPLDVDSGQNCPFLDVDSTVWT
jgi:hypothetical protein